VQRRELDEVHTALNPVLLAVECFIQKLNIGAFLQSISISIAEDPATKF